MSSTVMENLVQSGASMSEPKIQLLAYEVKLRTGARHLRVRQSRYNEALKSALHRVGTPARWLPGTQEWDYPLSPAAVIALEALETEFPVEIVWEGSLRDYAKKYVEQHRKDVQIRLEMEKFIRDSTLSLPSYVTKLYVDGGRPILPLRHQSIAYHWAQKVSALLLAWEPGTGKTR
ncbi:MAG: hypothetical protein RMM53_09190, partial [Bacteroidia bacterium]|nr:hypothetical protein [Bacteroidia bacterium]